MKNEELHIINKVKGIRNPASGIHLFRFSPFRHFTISPSHQLTKSLRHFFTILLLLLTPFLSSGQVAWEKKGGVCFRIDDNHELYQYNSFDSLFSPYGYKFCTAMCLESATWTPGYIDGMKQIWAQGHEFMDHAPNHSTCEMILTNISDTTLYHGNPFVDHINNRLVCFKWESVDTTTIQGEGPVNVTGNLVISVLPGEFQHFYDPVYIPMLFFPATNRVYTWSNLQNVNPLDPDSLTLISLWEEPVNIGILQNTPYHKLTSFDVRMPDEVLVMLGERVLDICEAYGIQRPYNWIQPYGNFPLLYKTDVKRTMGTQLGYIGGATYTDEAYKTYLEYNPAEEKQFAMMFFDFSLSHFTAKENKRLIANGIAKHLLFIGEDHFSPNTSSWHAYLQRTDSVLSWLDANNIPVLTERQWVSMLFDSVNNPYVDIFPQLQTDLNEDQIPDGYELTDGILINTDGVPQSANKSVQLTAIGTFFKIKGLGGLEKGTNNFSFYTKGTPGSIIWLRLYFPETGSGDIFPFTVDEAEWSQHTLPINIPQNVSVVNVELECQSYAGGELRISGMELRGIARPVVAQESVSLMTNQQFPLIALDTLIYDPNYSLQQLTISVANQGVLDYVLDTIAGSLWVFKPSSFWTGTDSLKVTAVNPEGGVGSAWLTFTATLTDICKGQTITLNLLNPPPGSTFLWTADPPDPSLVQPTIANPTVSPQQNTQYSVYVNAPGQPYTENLTVSVHLVENVALWGPLPAYCANAAPVQLYGTPAGGIFSGAGVAGAYFYPSLALVGPNTLRYTATDPSGCEGEDTLIVTIQPIPQLFLPPDSTICHWQTIFLDAGAGYDTYLWSTGDMTSSTAVSATGMLSDSTRHITLIVTKNGCAGFDTTVVHFKACTGIDSRMPDGGCLMIYPNPVSSELTLENQCSASSMEGKLIDLTGNIIASIRVNPGKTTWDTGAIPSGLYMLSVSGGGISMAFRIIIIQ